MSDEDLEKYCVKPAPGEPYVTNVVYSHIDELSEKQTSFRFEDFEFPVLKPAHAPTIAAIVKWLRNLDEACVVDWGLNATADIADMLESGRWAEDEP